MKLYKFLENKIEDYIQKTEEAKRKKIVNQEIYYLVLSGLAVIQSKDRISLIILKIKQMFISVIVQEIRLSWVFKQT